MQQEIHANNNLVLCQGRAIIIIFLFVISIVIDSKTNFNIILLIFIILLLQFFLNIFIQVNGNVWVTISFQLDILLLLLVEKKCTLTIICIRLQSSFISATDSICSITYLRTQIHILTYKHILFISICSVIYVSVTGERVIFEIGIIVCSIA